MVNRSGGERIASHLSCGYFRRATTGELSTGRPSRDATRFSARDHIPRCRTALFSIGVRSRA